MFIDLVGILLAVIGIALGAMGILLTHITFFAPGYWLNFLLSQNEKWREIKTPNESITLYRHEWFSGFSLECRFVEAVNDSFFETWMKGIYRPDKRAESYYVVLSLNGLPISTELFVSYDGSRNFVPVPTIVKDGRLGRYRFTHTQRSLARIVGHAHIEDSIDDLMNRIESSTYSAFLIEEFNPTSTSLDDLSSRITAAKGRQDAKRA